MEFVIFNRVALRFQHTPYDEILAREGQIKGDAYSLSYPKEWHPADFYKAREFQSELTYLVTRIIHREILSREQHAGTFLLFSDVERAHRPVTDRLYGGPFYPVGAFTTFPITSRIGEVPITAEVTAAVRQDARRGIPPSPAIVGLVAKGLSDKLAERIIAARAAGEEKTAALKAETAERVTRTANLQRTAAMFR